MPEETQEEVTHEANETAVPFMAFTRSESIAKIAKALVAAQKKLKNPEKNAKNPHFGNRYADLLACMDAAKECLNDQGIVLVQTYSPAPYGCVGVTTLALHESGEYVGGTCVIPLDRDNAQGYGSAATYARRYGVQAIVGMVAEDDDDGEVASRTEAKSPAAKAPQKKLSIFGGK